MPTNHTLKSLRALKKIRVERIANLRFCKGEEDAMREHIRKQIVDKFGEDAAQELTTDKDDNFIFRTNFWMKPKVARRTTGTLTFRSKDYTFMQDGEAARVSYGGDLKAEHLTEYGFKYADFEYHIITTPTQSNP